MENNDTILTFTVDFEFQWMDEPAATNNNASQTKLIGGGVATRSPEATVRS